MRIAILGKAKSGKNTVAELIAEYIKDYEIMAFADPLKEICKIIFPEALDNCLYGSSEFRSYILYNDITYRQFLLDIGKFGRNYSKNIWVECLLSKINKLKQDKTVIVSDCRFRNEFDILKDNNFYMIKVVRDNCEKINDVSETEQDAISNSEFHSIVFNNKTLEDLKLEVKNLVNNFEY
jgi:hypothetical protein